jgi:pyruvate formate lyase activating enzyme
MYDHRLCRRFGDCARTLPGAFTLCNDGIQINRPLISDTGKLKEVCVSKALTVVGEPKTTEDLLMEIEKDSPFYHRSNGGVTLSGGEPLSQGSDLINLLLELKKRNIDVSVETSLHVSWENVERCQGLVGTYLVDLKHIDGGKFRLYTQGDIGLVLNNLKKLAENKENIVIRIPVIPDFNHSEPEMKKIIDFAASVKDVREVHFIPYHTLGIEKYNMLGMFYAFGPEKQVEHEELKGYIEYAQAKGFKTITGG